MTRGKIAAIAAAVVLAVLAGLLVVLWDYDLEETKRAMLACHDSQRAWLRRQHGVDEYLDSCARWSGERGKAIGTQYGEAFRQHKGHPFPHDDLLMTTLQG